MFNLNLNMQKNKWDGAEDPCEKCENSSGNNTYS